MYRGQKIAFVIPAMNEEKAIGKVVTAIRSLTFENHTVADEIMVCNNNSTDNTKQAALDAGATVIDEPTPGYGMACYTAVKNLSASDVIVFVDGDDSCFLEQTFDLLNLIDEGADLAIGSRVNGQIERGALTPAQAFGNWLSATIIRMLWRENVTDLGPFRAIRTPVYHAIRMEDRAFGWTVEMQVKAIQAGFTVKETAVNSKLRIGQSKISGTLKGTILAGIGILSTIAKLRLREKEIKKYRLESESA